MLRWLAAPAQHALLIGLLISLLLHAGLLAWRHNAAPAAPPDLPALEIVLVNARTESAPAQAQVLAQNQVDGGGNAAQGLASNPLPQQGASANTVVLQAMRKRQLQLEAEQQELLTQLRSLNQTAPAQLAMQPWPDLGHGGQDEQEQSSVLENAQIAALANRVQIYNAQPRKQFVAPAAQATRYAAYLDAWRSRIEAIGTEHYPDDARGRIYGSLRLTVTIKSDGSLVDMTIDEPSAHAVLNQAARRIVQLAAPFAPFPPDLARETDLLVITRSWNFTNNTLETQVP